MKFSVAVVVSLATMGFGMGMLISGGATTPLAPFYSSLIAGSVAYWVDSPRAYDRQHVSTTSTANDDSD
jgi:hypothetical protein